MKHVEMTPEDFQNLLLEIKSLKKENKMLRNANKFLNNEIEAFNKFHKEHRKRVKISDSINTKNKKD